MEIVTLVDGPSLPVDALALAWALEARGFQLLRVDAGGLRVATTAESMAPLTADERTAIKQWKLHLLAILEYCDLRILKEKH